MHVCPAGEQVIRRGVIVTGSDLRGANEPGPDRVTALGREARR